MAGDLPGPTVVRAPRRPRLLRRRLASGATVACGPRSTPRGHAAFARAVIVGLIALVDVELLVSHCLVMVMIMLVQSIASCQRWSSSNERLVRRPPAGLLFRGNRQPRRERKGQLEAIPWGSCTFPLHSRRSMHVLSTASGNARGRCGQRLRGCERFQTIPTAFPVVPCYSSTVPTRSDTVPSTFQRGYLPRSSRVLSPTLHRHGTLSTQRDKKQWLR